MAESLQRPPLGHSLNCRIVDVTDGDTVEVEVTRRVRVRLIDCWAAESRSKDAHEKKAGIAAKLYLAGLAEGRRATLFIPTHGANRIGDVFSFDRVLGQLWLEDDRQSLAARQVAARHASTIKGGTLGQ